MKKVIDLSDSDPRVEFREPPDSRPTLKTNVLGQKLAASLFAKSPAATKKPTIFHVPLLSPDPDWSIEGLLGGLGPMAAIVFRNGKKEKITIGTDLDKRITLGEPPIPIDRNAIEEMCNTMNARRRKLLLSRARKEG